MVEKTKNGAEKKGTPLYVKIFIALFAGIAFGYVLNFMGGVENEIINGYVLPFFQFIGDLFIKLIKMIVVPLVFFCIIDAALSLGDIKKLRSIGVKTHHLVFSNGRYFSNHRSDTCQYHQTWARLAAGNGRDSNGSERTSGYLPDTARLNPVQPIPGTDKRRDDADYRLLPVPWICHHQHRQGSAAVM